MSQRAVLLVTLSLAVKTKNIAEYVKMHKLMERPIEELAMLYPQMWKKSEGYVRNDPVRPPDEYRVSGAVREE